LFKKKIALDMDSEQLSAQVALPVLFCGSHDKEQCLPESNRSRDSLSINIYNKRTGAGHKDRNRDEVWNIDVEKSVTKSTSFAKSEILIGSPSLMSIYAWYSNVDTDIQDEDARPARIYLRNLSQDDCLNSESHPKLFCSLHPQGWSVWSYKFHVGLINTREASYPVICDNMSTPPSPYFSALLGVRASSMA
jgi:hypothetical protein